jgi:hypothetical protein
VTTLWYGACLNGLAEGTGTLTWSSFGIPFLTQKFTDINGLTMKGGRPAASDAVNPSSTSWKITQCSDAWRKGDWDRTIQGQVPTGFDLAGKVIVNRLLNFAEQIV